MNKLTFRKFPEHSTVNSAGGNRRSAGSFFQNIFEFNHENKEDTFEYNDYKVKQPEYESKMHPISSIIEEEDEEEKESEMDLSYNSYPIINRKFIRRNYELPDTANVQAAAFQSVTRTRPPMQKSASISIDPSHRSSKNDLKQMPEICLKDLPVKVHSKFIQPVKYSYSDRYPCYTGPIPDSYGALSTKSKSYSHSQLRSAQHQSRILARTRRQDSIEEEWEQKSQKSHSSSSIKTSMSASKLADVEERVRVGTKSSHSYNTVHPIRRDSTRDSFEQQPPPPPQQPQLYHQPPQPQHYHQPLAQHYQQHHYPKHPQPYHPHPIYSVHSSQTNSNASIASRGSTGNRMMMNSTHYTSRR